MTDEELAAIKTRCEASTPGPWHTEEPGPYIHDVWASDGQPFYIAKGAGPRDARFIAHARTDIPALLEALERLRDMVVDAQTEAAMQAAEVERLRGVEKLLDDERARASGW